MKFIKNEEDLKNAISKLSINDSKMNDQNLQSAVEKNISIKNKQTEVDLFSQLSTAPNSPVAYRADLNEENKDQEDQELSEEQVGP